MSQVYLCTLLWINIVILIGALESAKITNFLQYYELRFLPNPIIKITQDNLDIMIWRAIIYSLKLLMKTLSLFIVCFFLWDMNTDEINVGSVTPDTKLIYLALTS